MSENWFALSGKEDLRKLWNPELEIVFLLRGTGRIYFADMKKEYAVKEKDIFVINPFELHNFELDEKAIALSFFVSLEFIASVTPELLKYKVDCRSFLHAGDRQEAFDVIRCDLAHIFQNQYKNEKGDAPHRKSRTAAILENLSRYFLDRETAVQTKHHLEMLKCAVNYIQCHYKEKISLDDLARETFLSKTYISRSFTKQLGVSFTEYVAMVRLAHVIHRMNGQETLAEIAFESGFANVNAMILTFKKYRGITPGEYRRMLEQKEGKQQAPRLMQETERDMFASLMEYVNEFETSRLQNAQVREITVHMSGRKQRISTHWRRILNAGYAKSLTDGAVRQELRYIQEKIGFEFIRVKGILNDEMCLLREDMNGSVVTNYTYVDEVIDFVLSVHAKPMIELGYMPRILAKKTQHQLMSSGIVSAPADMEAWEGLIRALMEHLTERYGMEKVRTWLFSPWISPDFAVFGECGLEEYEQVYAASYRAVKSVNDNILLAGPGCADDGRSFQWFLGMCRRENCMPDVFTFRSYAVVEGKQEENGLRLIPNNESFSMATSGDEDYLKHIIESFRSMMKQEGVEMLPLVLEEWSNTVWQRDLCNDTCFKSAYLFKNILENNEFVNAMGYFVLNDRMDEVPPAGETFHGGFGLFTKNHIPKSACRAMELLSRMGDRLLESGDGYLIAQKEEEIQIYLYNYCHYDLLYRYRHMVNMERTSRYKVFVPKEPQAFYIQLSDVEPGAYDICRYGITREGGSSYDLWVKMGAPEPLRREEEELLREMSAPQYHRERAVVKQGENVLEVKANVEPLDVWLITIRAV